LKKHLFNTVKLLLITFVIASSGAALYGQITGSQIDPIKLVLSFQPENTRDQPPVEEGEFTWWRKVKSTMYGAITGKICDEYSAYGAISFDYTIYGDLRDLVVQSWKYLNDEEIDGVIIALSAYGIVLSVAPNLPFKTIYLKGFLNKNPIVVLGLSRSHFVIHTFKILKKYHLVGLMIPLMGLFLILSLLPPYVTAIVFAVSIGYLMIILFQIFNLKGET
jgi:hypothetical protein